MKAILLAAALAAASTAQAAGVTDLTKQKERPRSVASPAPRPCGERERVGEGGCVAVFAPADPGFKPAWQSPAGKRFGMKL